MASALQRSPPAIRGNWRDHLKDGTAELEEMQLVFSWNRQTIQITQYRSRNLPFPSSASLNPIQANSLIALSPADFGVISSTSLAAKAPPACASPVTGPSSLSLFLTSHKGPAVLWGMFCGIHFLLLTSRPTAGTLRVLDRYPSLFAARPLCWSMQTPITLPSTWTSPADGKTLCLHSGIFILPHGGLRLANGLLRAIVI